MDGDHGKGDLGTAVGEARSSHSGIIDYLDVGRGQGQEASKQDKNQNGCCMEKIDPPLP